MGVAAQSFTLWVLWTWHFTICVEKLSASHVTNCWDGHARLDEAEAIRIAAGEWLATRFEFLDLMDRGKVSVLQPDVGRVGGFTEAKRVCNLAQQRNVPIVPHRWKSGISIAPAAHL